MEGDFAVEGDGFPQNHQGGHRHGEQRPADDFVHGEAAFLIERGHGEGEHEGQGQDGLHNEQGAEPQGQHLKPITG